jgi:hypothetical protein
MWNLPLPVQLGVTMPEKNLSLKTRRRHRFSTFGKYEQVNTTYPFMRVAGFTFIRNAQKYDYPIVEAITSVLPLCDEFVVAVGNSEDQTLSLIESIHSDKIRVIHTIWNDDLREGGRVLAEETDKALAAVSSDVDWAFYIQGDEVLHEKYIPVVKEAMSKHLKNNTVEGLLFKYLHFYGSYEFVGDSRRWYRREIRVIRNTKDVFAYRDAQGFRKIGNRKLRVKLIDAYIHHYGWVKSLDKQRAKFGYFYKFWHTDEQMSAAKDYADNFQFENHIDSLIRFSGTHPAVMNGRLQSLNSTFDFDITQKRYTPRVRFLTFMEKITGWRIGEYKNYRLL